MRLHKFSRQLCKSVIDQFWNAGVAVRETTQISETEFEVETVDAVLKFRCFAGDKRRYECFVTVEPRNGVAKTLSVVSRKSNATDNPEVKDALGVKRALVDAI